MKLLVDAHALIWHAEDDERLSSQASAAMVNPKNEIFVSAATFWELTIKESLGKLKLKNGVAQLHREWIASRAASLLSIEWHHLEKLAELPWIHRDPFDRILVAQALSGGLSLLTLDPEVASYPGLNLFII